MSHDEARPALLRCLKKLEHGDTLTVWKLDRLGRSLRDLITMLDDLKERGVKFRSLTEAIDTETPTGRAMWQMTYGSAIFMRGGASTATPRPRYHAPLLRWDDHEQQGSDDRRELCPSLGVRL